MAVNVTARDRNGEGQGTRRDAETGKARRDEVERVRAGGEMGVTRQARQGRRDEVGEGWQVWRGR